MHWPKQDTNSEPRRIARAGVTILPIEQSARSALKLADRGHG